MAASVCVKRKTREAACELFDLLDYPHATAELQRQLQLGLSSICSCLGQGLCMGQPLILGRFGRFAWARLALAFHQPQRLERLGARPELLPVGSAVVLQSAIIDFLGSGICNVS